MWFVVWQWTDLMLLLDMYVLDQRLDEIQSSTAAMFILATVTRHPNLGRGWCWNGNLCCLLV
jgi:hypothetical protein